MAWKRMQSEEEQSRKGTHEQIRGFFPFTEDANLEGTLEAVKLKDNGAGFFLVRCTKPSTVNVRDEESKTGQGKAQIGEIVGIRKVGSTKIIASLPIGTLISVTYRQFAEKLNWNPKTQQKENTMYHYIDVDVYEPDDSEVA